MTSTRHCYLCGSNLAQQLRKIKKDIVIWFYFAGHLWLTRTNTIAANALLNIISSYRFGEPNHRSLGGTIDTPVHNTCVKETHMSHTHGHTQTRKAMICDKRITMNMVILQRLNVPLIEQNICYRSMYSEICGRSFTFYAWCNRCHVNDVSWLFRQHLDWQNKLRMWHINWSKLVKWRLKLCNNLHFYVTMNWQMCYDPS